MRPLAQREIMLMYSVNNSHRKTKLDSNFVFFQTYGKSKIMFFQSLNFRACYWQGQDWISRATFTAGLENRSFKCKNDSKPKIKKSVAFQTETDRCGQAKTIPKRHAWTQLFLENGKNISAFKYKQIRGYPVYQSFSRATRSFVARRSKSLRPKAQPIPETTHEKPLAPRAIRGRGPNK